LPEEIIKDVFLPANLGVYYTASEDLVRSEASSFVVTVTARDGKGGENSQALTVEVTANTPPTVSCSGTSK
jgi:hypothetical protein